MSRYVTVPQYLGGIDDAVPNALLQLEDAFTRLENSLPSNTEAGKAATLLLDRIGSAIINAQDGTLRRLQVDNIIESLRNLNNTFQPSTSANVLVLTRSLLKYSKAMPQSIFERLASAVRMQPVMVAVPIIGVVGGGLYMRQKKRR